MQSSLCKENAFCKSPVAFWAADGLAKEIREGGRYAYRLQPKTAANFVSRYRAALTRRSRRKAKDDQPPAPSPAA